MSSYILKYLKTLKYCIDNTVWVLWILKHSDDGYYVFIQKTLKLPFSTELSPNFLSSRGTIYSPSVSLYKKTQEDFSSTSQKVVTLKAHSLVFSGTVINIIDEHSNQRVRLPHWSVDKGHLNQKADLYFSVSSSTLANRWGRVSRSCSLKI